MNAGYKRFLYCLLAAGLLPSISPEHLWLKLKTQHFIYPTLICILTWFNFIRYTIYLLFFHPGENTLSENLYRLMIINYYLLCCVSRSVFLYQNWRRRSFFKLNDRCFLDEHSPIWKNLDGYIWKGQHKTTVLWTFLATNGVMLAVGNTAFVALMTYLERDKFGVSNFMVPFQIWIPPESWTYILLYIGCLISKFCSDVTVLLVNGFTMGLVMTVVQYLLDVRICLKNFQTEKERLLKITNIHNVYYHFAEMGKSIAKYASIQVGFSVTFCSLGLMVIVYQLTWGRTTEDQKVLFRVVWGYWLAAISTLFFIVVVPSLYLNGTAKNCRKEIYRIDLDQMTNENGDYNNVALNVSIGPDPDPDLDPDFDLELAHPPLNVTIFVHVFLFF